MRNDTIKSLHFSRRALVIGGGKLLLLSALGARLYQLQIIEAEKYQDMAEGNRIRIFPTLPRRGRLLDRTGKEMAKGYQRYQVIFEPMGEKTADAVLERAADILAMDFNSKQALLKKLARLKFNETLIVQDFVEWDTVARMEVHSHEMPGISVTKPEIRAYPYAEIAANITGYIGIPREKDVQDNPLYRNPDFRIGMHGLEQTQEARLQGTPGVREVEVDAHGLYVRELSLEKDKPGEDLTLTVDMELQQYAVELMRGKGGLKKEGASAVVMHIPTGNVLALAAVPSYDPNQFVRGIKQDYWDELRNNPDTPLNNKPVGLLYPPGSTFKPITVLAALHYGVANENTRFFCPGHYDFGGRFFHCWQRRGHGSLNMAEAIMASCNVYMFNLARRLGIDRIAEIGRQFGLGEKSGIELPSEKAGIMPDNDWKKATYNKQWYMGETLNCAIGQGYTLTTTLQLAQMCARIASGKKITPTLLASRGAEDMEMVQIDNGEKILLPIAGRSFEPMDFSAAHFEIVRRGMTMVMNQPRGSGYRLKIPGSPILLAGKTGTAQVLSRSFKNTPDARHERFHALFIGYAPAENPIYAAAVVVEHGGYGAGSAAPIGRDLLIRAFEKEMGG